MFVLNGFPQTLEEWQGLSEAGISVDLVVTVQEIVKEIDEDNELSDKPVCTNQSNELITQSITNVKKKSKEVGR